ncbi:FecCD family ABC transporter permease [Pseudomonas sp. EL_65y_Pfl2_R95]|uniref:FecCD family ABC transporter permease n=1 Tax=Pseudomonas sp. EL_65y_Pfl2_R95 TaxID=3088698 RepID=UPI0030D74FE4
MSRLNAVLLAVLGLLFLLSLTIGAVPLGLDDVARGLLNQATGSRDLTDVAVQQQIIVKQIRLPRVILAILVGMSLGVSGAALQGLLRNPLAEPGLLGVSSSASLGAVVCLYYGLSALNPWLLPVAAMGCAALATLILYLIARRRASNLTLILAGIGLSALCSALTSLAISLAPNPTDMQDIVLWLMGSLSDRSFADIQLCLPFIAAGVLLLLACGPQLDALTLGEDEASSLGVSLPRLRGQIILGTALCVGASVAVTGAIGFIGLVVPHLLRKWVGYHPSRLLLSSAIGGAVLLLAADILLRLISGEQELMLGVVTALLGAPFFLMLVLRQRLVNA